MTGEINGASKEFFALRRFSELLKKELAELFSRFPAYLVIAIFIAIVSYSFTTILFFQRSVTVIHAVAQAANLLLLIIPLLTMRAFSKEREAGVLEILLSTPCSELEIVLAKYFAGLCFLSLIVFLCFCYPLTLSLIGYPDHGQILSSYLGLFLMSACLLAIGLCVASFFHHAVLAAVASFGIFIGFWLIDHAAYVVPIHTQSWIEHLSFDVHLSRFLTGAVFVSDMTFFIVLSIAAIVVAVARLSAR
ncbi:MAG: ABC transporter permease [Pseudomonadota bacterium]